MTSLYHYTSGNSLQGIIQSKKLWATDIRFLNDYEELYKGLKLFEKFSEIITEDLLKQENISKPTCELIEIFISNIRSNAELTPIHLVSLTTKHDNLRQWMAYCKSEVGYCIEFDSDILIPDDLNRFNNSIKLNKIEYIKGYSDIIYPDSLNDMKDSLMKLLSDLHSNYDSKSGLDTDQVSLEINKFILKAIFLASSIKPMEFQDESEYRLIYLGKKKEKDIQPPMSEALMKLYSKPELPESDYRAVGDVIIPYQPIPFNINAIKSVVIGPTSNTKLAKLGLSELRDRNNLCFDIYDSECSLRRF